MDACATTVAQGMSAGDRAVRTRLETNTWREVEYHVDSGEMFLVGEQAHGFDFYDVSSGAGGRSTYWRCNMNRKARGDGLLEFLFENNLNGAAMQAEALSNGFGSFAGPGHRFINLTPLGSVRVCTNRAAPADGADIDSTTRPRTDDYLEHPDKGEGVFFTLHIDGTGEGDALGQGTKGLVYMELCHASLKLGPGDAPGDGSSDRDNGVRADLAFKAAVPLSEEKKAELLRRFECTDPLHSDRSTAYDFTPAKGL